MLAKPTRFQISPAAVIVSSLLVFAFSILPSSQPAFAEITWSGSIDPEDPTSWTRGTQAVIGKTGEGNLTVEGDSDLLTLTGCIGFDYDSTGSATISGAGSTWTNYHGIVVGGNGSGTLDIVDGGSAVDSNDIHSSFHYGYIAYGASSTGVVTVDGEDSTWTTDGNFYVGYDGCGTLNVSNGGTVKNRNGYIGHNAGSTGTVTVDGDGSTWINEYILSVGLFGNGLLEITNGGHVHVGGLWTSISQETSNTGRIHFGPGGGILTTHSLYASPTQLTGTGTINTCGLVSDIDLVFDSTHGAVQTIILDDEEDQNIAINLDMSGLSESAASLGVGFFDKGSIIIREGITINSSSGQIGILPGSIGIVTVDGSDSIWAISSSLSVGSKGNGTLDITDGGLVHIGSTLTIYSDANGDSFINMTTGGKLALKGDGDDSLAQFMDMIDGSDAIRYWDYSIADWADITGATYGDDYTLAYMTAGDLAGYTVLTVGVSQPSIIGDANCDGTVDGRDAAIMARYWLTEEEAVWGMGDFNGDSAVNDIDAAILAANWGNTPDATVPEPSALAGMLSLAVFCLLASRRKGNVRQTQ